RPSPSQIHPLSLHDALPICFAETARVLRRDGRAAFLEVAQPRSPLVRSAHSLYFNRVVPALGALISDRRAYEYLPASVAYLPGSDRKSTRLNSSHVKISYAV